MAKLTRVHAQYLIDHAVMPKVIRDVGIYSVTKATELPEAARRVFDSHGKKILPCIVFPWRTVGGDTKLQLKHSVGVKTDGDTYLWTSTGPAQLGLVRSGDGTVLIVEGTKQALAAASWAAENIAVFGIAGCRSWMADGVPTPDLEVADGREVVVILDADAASNLDVYEAGMRLREALEAEGASSVRFARLPAGGKAGLDDVLGARPMERRAGVLERLIAGAKTKPADRKPKPKSKKDDLPPPPTVEGRATVVIEGDRLDVINNLVTALRTKWDGTELFNYGGAITKLDLKTAVLDAVSKDRFLNLIQEAAITGVMTNAGWVHSWPDQPTRSAAYASADKFTPLERVTQVPFIRPDGSVCQKPGYDADTKTILLPTEGVDQVEVPDEPTPEQVAAAAELILGDWLGDMPFKDDASRANALALVMTPIIQTLIPFAPLAVIDGKQMSSGKNLLADCVAIMVTGRPADPLPYIGDDDAEQRKQITAAFRTGAQLFVWDEAHELRGSSFARALTSATYKDRILGASEMVEFPNQVTWMSLGNQVKVQGDMSRRVYRIALWPTEDDPQDRDINAYRHPDLRGWTRTNRHRLISAALTIARAWHAAGCPESSRGSSFGSFETWERVVGGMITHAGVGGFLDNIKTWRSENDFDYQHWLLHLVWLHNWFADRQFTCAEVKDRALADTDFQGPPGLEDVTSKGFTRALGKAYASHTERGYQGYRLLAAGEDAKRKVKQWEVHGPEGGPEGDSDSTPPQDDERGLAGFGGVAHPLRVGKKHTLFGSGDEKSMCVSHKAGGTGTPPNPATPRQVVVDLETGGTDLWSAGPEFIRLAGVQIDSGEIETTTEITEVVEHVNGAGRIVGHNLLSFDLLALARHHGVDIVGLANVGRIADLMILARQADPPQARDKGADYTRKYDLDSLGEKYGLGGKHSDLKALAKEFGGYDQIPVDDERYVEYLRRDVELTAALDEKLTAELGDDPYIEREHRVAAVAAQMSLNGFRADVELVNQRIEAGRKIKDDTLWWLSDAHGLPMTKADGKPAASPHATKEGKLAIARAFKSLGAKMSKTRTGEPALGKDALDRLVTKYGHLDGVTQLVEAVKAINGIRTVYQTTADNLVGDRVHPAVSFRQASGRWSITDPGLTVMGKRGDRHHEREIFLPEPGHVIIAADLSQVDARAIAVHAQDPMYLELFEPGRDAHLIIAEMVWGKRTKEARSVAKVIGHGWNYGMGMDKLVKTAGVSHKVAAQFDRVMKARFTRLVAWRQGIRDQAKAGALLDNGFGRKMRPDPQRAWTQGPALMGQGCARDLMMEGLLRLPVELLGFLRAVVHDEIVLSVPETDVDEIQREVVKALCFQWAPPGADLPVNIEADIVGRGHNWGAVYDD